MLNLVDWCNKNLSLLTFSGSALTIASVHGLQTIYKSSHDNYGLFIHRMAAVGLWMIIGDTVNAMIYKSSEHRVVEKSRRWHQYDFLIPFHDVQFIVTYIRFDTLTSYRFWALFITEYPLEPLFQVENERRPFTSSLIYQTVESICNDAVPCLTCSLYIHYDAPLCARFQFLIVKMAGEVDWFFKASITVG